MKVLLLTDFSKHAQNGITYAMAMLKGKKVDYILLNTYIEPYTSADMLISIRDILAKQSEEQLTIQADKLQKHISADKQSVKTLAIYGTLPHTVSAVIKEEKIDMVIMGTHGKEGLVKLLKGSHAESLARKIKCPLLIIPEHYKYQPIKSIALALGSNSLTHKQTLTPILKLGEEQNAQLLVVHVQSDEDKTAFEQADVRIKHILGDTPYHFHYIEDDNIVTGINHFVNEKKAGMLAVVPGRYGTISGLFHKSITKRIASSSNIPVMVLHEKN